jgi:hypothetical protein
MLQIPVTHRSGSNDKRAIFYGLGDSFIPLRIRKDLGSTNGGACFSKGWRVRIHKPERLKPEIAHGSGDRSNIQRIARSDQDDVDAAKVVDGRHGVPIVRHGFNYTILDVERLDAMNPMRSIDQMNWTYRSERTRIALEF